MNSSLPTTSIQKTSSHWLLAAAIVVSLVVLGGMAFAAFFGVMSLLKSAKPYQHALTAAVANPQVQSALGTPISEGWMISGNISTVNDSGHASLAIPISGPKGGATIWVEAKRSAKAWTYSVLEVAVTGQPDHIKLAP